MTDDFESTKFEEPDPEEVERLFAKAARIFSAKSAPPARVPERVSVGGIDPASIPPLKPIKNFPLCSEVTLLGGTGGVGKSLFGWNVAASVAAGKAFTWCDEHEHPATVIILSGEDDTFEVWRRVAAFDVGYCDSLQSWEDKPCADGVHAGSSADRRE